MKVLSCEILVPAGNTIKSGWLPHGACGGYEAGNAHRGNTTPAPEGHIKNCLINTST